MSTQLHYINYKNSINKLHTILIILLLISRIYSNYKKSTLHVNLFIYKENLEKTMQEGTYFLRPVTRV